MSKNFTELSAKEMNETDGGKCKLDIMVETVLTLCQRKIDEIKYAIGRH